MMVATIESHDRAFKRSRVPFVIKIISVQLITDKQRRSALHH